MIVKHNIAAFSSNYPLYGDMSSRVMNILSTFTPEMEIYSIDEAFLNFSNFGIDINEYSLDMRKKILQYTGLPVSIGIAKTKTLSKIANAIAKSQNSSGVFSFIDNKKTDSFLREFPVDKIWGVGRRSSIYLRSRGIKTAYQLKNTPFYTLKSKMGVNAQKIIDELNNVSVYSLDDDPASVKGIRSSRTFPGVVKDKNLLKEAISTYATRAGDKLRHQGLKAGFIVVFLKTNIFSSNYQKTTKTIHFDVPENNTSKLIKASMSAIDEIFEPDLSYKKAGILLGDLRDENTTQLSLFEKNDLDKSDLLMNSMDKINKKFGKDTLKFASCGVKKNQEWRIRCENRSPSYTTDWNQLPKVK
jgi:DNA polymerase V